MAMTRPSEQTNPKMKEQCIAMKIHSLRKRLFVSPAKPGLVLVLHTLTLLLFAAGSATRSYAGTNDNLAGGSTNLRGPTGNAAASQAPATNGQAVEMIPAAMQLVGRPVPKAFKLPLLAGGEIELPPPTNHGPLVLDFCATWCKPSRDTMPVVSDIAKEYSGRGVRFVAANQGEAPEKIRSYLARAKLDMTVALDNKCGMAGAFRVTGIPTIVIVDRSNTVRYVHVGSSPELGDELRRALDEVLKAESGQGQCPPQADGHGNPGSENRSK
jgi:thiol-disulfide isomerase/thioredoxin